MSAISPANLAVSSSNSAAASTQIRPAANASTQATKEQATTTLKSDTVKLSLAASIALMHHQGMSASVIAATLGVSVKQVDGYIPGSTSSTAASATVTTAQTQQAAADTQKASATV